MEQMNTEILNAVIPQGALGKKGKAIVLLSGGLDSTTVLYIALSEGYDVYPISFNYKQRHVVELMFAWKTLDKVSIDYGVNIRQRWKIFNLDFSQILGSALTDHSLELPKDRPVEDMDKEIPISYVPLRNTIFLAYAAAVAEAMDARHIFAGMNCLDYSGYPDCRPEYISAITKALNLGSRAVDEPSKTLSIHVPLIDKNKADIIKIGRSLGVDYYLTWSCYDPIIRHGIHACNKCDSCILRANGFSEAGF